MIEIREIAEQRSIRLLVRSALLTIIGIIPGYPSAEKKLTALWTFGWCLFSREKKNPGVYKEMMFVTIAINTSANTVHLVHALKYRLVMKSPFKIFVCSYYWKLSAPSKESACGVNIAHRRAGYGTRFRSVVFLFIVTSYTWSKQIYKLKWPCYG